MFETDYTIESVFNNTDSIANDSVICFEHVSIHVCVYIQNRDYYCHVHVHVMYIYY